MAELITLFGHGSEVDSYTTTDLRNIVDRILPANAPRNLEITRDDGCLACRINASESLPTHGLSTCLGRLVAPADSWYKPETSVPDGSYGIVRVSSETIELVADTTASRTIYYRLFDDLFVVSTSQRAIAHFADDFIPDETSIAWMVSSGTLGPRQAWDARTEHVPPGGMVRLDRSTWKLRVTKPTIQSLFNTNNDVVKLNCKNLNRSINNTLKNIDIEAQNWALALSGGMDSRGLIQNLHNRPELAAVTWGTADAINDPNSDAVRARELADAYEIPHEYYELPQHPSDIATVFDRFVTAGEGRIDHISGYLDKFDTFETLSNDYVGIIRGNNPFGWSKVISSIEVRWLVGGQLISDYDTLASLSIPGKDEQCWPSEFEQTDDESLPMWRDRLKLTYRLAKIQSALSSLKTPYIEEINPFLSREIVQTVCTLPDELRTEKRLYHDYVQNQGPSFPVATQSANPDAEQLLASEESRNFLRSRLDTEQARSVLGHELIDHALDELYADSGPKNKTGDGSLVNKIKRQVGTRLPQSVIRHIEANTSIERPSVSISGPRLSFRLYIVTTMVDKMERDTNQL